MAMFISYSDTIKHTEAELPPPLHSQVLVGFLQVFGVTHIQY